MQLCDIISYLFSFPTVVGGKENVCRWNQITDQQIYYKKKNLITLNITWNKATYCLACYSVGGSSCCFYAFFTSG